MQRAPRPAHCTITTHLHWPLVPTHLHWPMPSSCVKSATVASLSLYEGRGTTLASVTLSPGHFLQFRPTDNKGRPSLGQFRNPCNVLKMASFWHRILLGFVSLFLYFSLSFQLFLSFSFQDFLSFSFHLYLLLTPACCSLKQQLFLIRAMPEPSVLVFLHFSSFPFSLFFFPPLSSAARSSNRGSWFSLERRRNPVGRKADKPWRKPCGW